MFYVSFFIVQIKYFACLFSLNTWGVPISSNQLRNPILRKEITVWGTNEVSSGTLCRPKEISIATFSYNGKRRFLCRFSSGSAKKSQLSPSEWKRKQSYILSSNVIFARLRHWKFLRSSTFFADATFLHI